jgi:hypothetical protein
MEALQSRRQEMLARSVDMLTDGGFSPYLQ